MQISRYHKGDKIGNRYLVHQVLIGGMGEVYLCLDLAQQVPIALKTFQSRFFDNPNLRAAFLAEIATWVSLGRHPHIVQCFYMETVENQPFMALEWIPSDEYHGVDLRAWVRLGPLSTQVALDFAIDICRGLVHAGRVQPGIVHRDLKPENVLIARGLYAKITDFGLAKTIQQAKLNVNPELAKDIGRKSLFGAGAIVGTPQYMAPEQWRSTELDARTDVYALGCIVYEMLTGHLAFDGRALDEMRRQHLEQAFPHLPGKGRLGDRLDVLLKRCTAKELDARFGSPESVLNELAIVYEEHIGHPPRNVPDATPLSGAERKLRALTFKELGLYDKALADINEVLESEPNDPILIGTRAIVYYRMGRHHDALSEHNRAVELNPGQFRVFSDRGNVLSALGRHEEALADFSRAIERAADFTVPELAVLYSNRGLTLSELERFEEALADLNRAVHLDPFAPGHHCNRGSILRHLHRLEEAAAEYTRAIELNPVLLEGIRGRATVNVMLGRFAQAEADISRTFEIEPRNVDSCIAFAGAYLAIGTRRGDQRLTDRGEQFFVKAREIGGVEAIADFKKSFAEMSSGAPDVPAAWEARGLFMIHMADYEEAIRSFDRGLDLDPQSTSLLNNKGFALHKIGRRREALECFNRVIEIKPDDSTAWNNKANEMAMMGHYEEALNLYERALELNPASSHSAQGRSQCIARLQAGPPFRCPSCQGILRWNKSECERIVAMFGGGVACDLCQHCGLMLEIDTTTCRVTAMKPAE